MSRLLFAIALVVWSVAALGAQTDDTLAAWLRNRIEARVATGTAMRAVEVNSNRAIRQKESPTGDARSTSLVDESSATDFVNVAMALTPMPSGGSAAQGHGGTGVVTASAYSLLALFNKKSLTDPEFYEAHTGARQLSFSFGSTASDPAKDQTGQAGTTVGFKYTLLNDREIYSRRSRRLLGNLQDTFSKVTSRETRVQFQVLILFFCASVPRGVTGVDQAEMDSFCAAPLMPRPSQPLAEAFGKYTGEISNPAPLAAAIKGLPASTLSQVDALIDANLVSFSSLREAINSTYDQIKQGRQLALASTYVNRPELGTDDFRTSLIFDYGLSSRVNWTVNGSFDYRDRKMGFDTRGGRFATEFLGRLTGYGEDLWGRQPITIAFAGEGKWLTLQKPQYSVQAKLTIPIAAGLDLPIVYRWAKRIDLVDKEGKELRFGITVDLGNLSQLLKAK